jgi:hypothetical protein
MRRPPIDLTTLLLAAAAVVCLVYVVLGEEPDSSRARALLNLVGPDLYPLVSRGIFGFVLILIVIFTWLRVTDRLRLDRWAGKKRRQARLIDHAIRRDL